MYDRLPGGAEISNLDFAGYSQLFAWMHFQRSISRLAQTELTKPPFHYNESSCLQTSQFPWFLKALR